MENAPTPSQPEAAQLGPQATPDQHLATMMGFADSVKQAYEASPPPHYIPKERLEAENEQAEYLQKRIDAENEQVAALKRLAKARKAEEIQNAKTIKEVAADLPGNKTPGSQAQASQPTSESPEPARASEEPEANPVAAEPEPIAAPELKPADQPKKAAKRTPAAPPKDSKFPEWEENFEWEQAEEAPAAEPTPTAPSPAPKPWERMGLTEEQYFATVASREPIFVDRSAPQQSQQPEVTPDPSEADTAVATPERRKYTNGEAVQYAPTREGNIDFAFEYTQPDVVIDFATDEPTLSDPNRQISFIAKQDGTIRRYLLTGNTMIDLTESAWTGKLQTVEVSDLPPLTIGQEWEYADGHKVRGVITEVATLFNPSEGVEAAAAIVDRRRGQSPLEVHRDIKKYDLISPPPQSESRTHRLASVAKNGAQASAKLAVKAGKKAGTAAKITAQAGAYVAYRAADKAVAAAEKAVPVIEKGAEASRQWAIARAREIGAALLDPKYNPDLLLPPEIDVERAAVRAKDQALFEFSRGIYRKKPERFISVKTKERSVKPKDEDLYEFSQGKYPSRRRAA